MQRARAKMAEVQRAQAGAERVAGAAQKAPQAAAPDRGAEARRGRREAHLADGARGLPQAGQRPAPRPRGRHRAGRRARFAHRTDAARQCRLRGRRPAGAAGTAVADRAGGPGPCGQRGRRAGAPLQQGAGRAVARAGGRDRRTSARLLRQLRAAGRTPARPRQAGAAAEGRSARTGRAQAQLQRDRRLFKGDAGAGEAAAQAVARRAARARTWTTCSSEAPARRGRQASCCSSRCSTS